MIKKNILITGLVIFTFSTVGCASLKGNVPFEYQPSLVSVKKIDKIAGVNLLIDNRPKSDVSNTKSIKDIADKVTSKLLEDFDKSKLFKEIHYLEQQGDDIVITGSIDRFSWRMEPNPIMFVPILSCVIYLGVPAQTAYGKASITLELKNIKNGKVLGIFTESSEVKSDYTIYNFKAGEAGSELAEAFREVVKKIKESIVKKINF